MSDTYKKIYTSLFNNNEGFLSLLEKREELSDFVELFDGAQNIKDKTQVYAFSNFLKQTSELTALLNTFFPTRGHRYFVFKHDTTRMTTIPVEEYERLVQQERIDNNYY